MKKFVYYAIEIVAMAVAAVATLLASFPAMPVWHYVFFWTLAFIATFATIAMLANGPYDWTSAKTKALNIAQTCNFILEEERILSKKERALCGHVNDRKVIHIYNIRGEIVKTLWG